MKILKIYWERTYINIEFESEEKTDLFLEYENKKIYFNIIHLKDNLYKARLNITIANEGTILNTNNYMISSSTNFSYDNNLLLELENLSRVFKYGGIYACVISFSLKNFDDREISLYMQLSYMIKNNNPKKSRFIREHRSFKSLLKDTFRIYLFKFINIIYFVNYYVYRLFRNKKSILFMSENRFAMSENLSAINQRLRDRNILNNFNIRHSYRNIFDKRYSFISWFKLINKICKSDYIFIDDYTPIFKSLNLNKKQVLVQTWHAGFGFKLVGYGRFGISGSPHPFYSSHRNYTYGLIGCDSLKEIYSEVWGISENKLIPSGMPRLDHFLDKDVIQQSKEEIYTKYPNLQDKKIILYAPTYRGLNQRSAYFDYSVIDFDKLYQMCKKENYILLFKQHHFIQTDVPIPDEYKDTLIEIKDININKLFYITDILITDYSSCFYDFTLLKKPMLFYAFDKYVYSATRGVHRKLEDVAPGKICENFDDLLEAIYKKDFEIEKINSFFVDNNATGKIASDIVINKILLGQEYSK